ncbi:MAG: hypothetical protein H3Z52_12460 [archaeon]|nr:hypothetical protein [archaeon]
MNQSIGFKLEAKDRELIEKVCRARGENISSFVRRAVRRELAGLSFYPNETMKALGLIAEKEAKSR